MEQGNLYRVKSNIILGADYRVIKDTLSCIYKRGKTGGCQMFFYYNIIFHTYR